MKTEEIYSQILPKTELEELRETIEALQKANEELQGKNESLVKANGELTTRLNWLIKQLFGKKTERDVEAKEKQLTFDFFEEEEKKPDNGEKKVVAEHTRKKPNRNGQDAIDFPEDIPEEIIYLDIPDSEKVCPETGEPLVLIGEEVTKKLAFRVGSYFIKKIIRPKYANPQREEDGVIIESLPDTIIPKCRADESLLAEIVTKKFADHLPLNRISEIMSRDGIKISRKLLSQWIVKCGMALVLLYNVMMKLILRSGNIFIDETPVKVFDKQTKRNGFMWVIVGGAMADPPYRVYDFRMNRRHINVFDILADYQGVMHSDKYEAYQKVSKKKGIFWSPCWAHIRRKFFEIPGNSELKSWILRKIRYLFMFERVAWARTPEERLWIRKEKEVPIIDEIIAKVNDALKKPFLPKSNLGKALQYFHGLIPHLKTYTEHAYARLDNNPAERAIRPLALGRKNWLFFGSEQGGQAAAVLLSLVQTCRGLNINPKEYLEDIFRRIMSHSAQKLEELLPDQWLLAKMQKAQEK
jgi:transposase